MQNLKETIESRLSPLWGAITAAIVALYGFWPGIFFYNEFVVKAKDGMGWLPFLIFGFLGFAFVVAIGSYLVGGLFCLMENMAARIGISLALVLVFWTQHGVPHPFVLAMILLCAVSGYFQVRKAREDASDREEFFNE